MSNPKDVNKLTSIDEFGNHIFLIPAEVKGFFRTHRTRLQWILLVFFLVMPWITWNGKQLIMLNVGSREFVLFGVIFRAHDAPLLFFLLSTVVLGIALVTAIWGRVWCGWACPQTVFIDGLYRKIEWLTEGTYIERRRLQLMPWSLGKLKMKVIKWGLFILVSSIISHSFIAYFTGSRELIEMIQRPPSQNWTYFLLVAFFTGVSLFNFAWFREQFCVIMCPYGRIQSVLLEPSSLAVVYDEKRGEPRRTGITKSTNLGDCVGCNRCVEVCPTGIDIRNGIQMECIACTACIDACDEIMAKVKKPKGLISYRTLSGAPFKIINFKTVIYGFFVFSSVGGLTYNLKTRDNVNISVLRAIDTPFTRINDENGTAIVINHFRLHMTSQISVDSAYTISLPEEAKKLGVKLVVAQNPLVLPANQSGTFHLFIQIPLAALKSESKREVRLLIQDPYGTQFDRDLTLLGPSL